MKTFKDLGLEFKANSDCVTCDGYSCHNNLIHKITGKEYNVHISIDTENDHYSIYATLNSTSDFEIEENFDNENEAVNYLLENFENINCF